MHNRAILIITHNKQLHYNDCASHNAVPGMKKIFSRPGGTSQVAGQTSKLAHIHYAILNGIYY